jgi:hypothetical protein
MASTKNWGSIALNAAADLTGKLFYLAKIDGSGNGALASAATDSVVGVIVEEAVQDKPITVQVMGIAKVVAGGTITAGNRLTSDGNGKAIATSSAGNRTFGIAMASAVAGDIVSVLLIHEHVAVS